MTLFDLAFLDNKVKELEAKQNEEGFWNDQKTALKVIEEYNDAKEERDTYLKIEKTHEDIKELLFATSESDEDMKSLIEEMLDEISKNARNFRQKLLLRVNSTSTTSL